MKPTQYELAMIAAVYTGGGGALERIESALALWAAAGSALDSPEKPVEVPDTLEKLLLKTLPKARTRADRLKCFRDFIEWEIKGGGNSQTTITETRMSQLHGTKLVEVPLTKKKLDAEIQRQMEQFRKNGVDPTSPFLEKFRNWYEARAALVRSEKARKGGEARSGD